MFKIFKNLNFSFLALAKLSSLTGSALQDFALSLYVLKLTGQAGAFASILAVAIIPQIILGPIAGVFADWFDRRKLMIVLDCLSGLIVGVGAFAYVTNGKLNMVMIYGMVIGLSIISTMFNTTSTAFLVNVISKEEYVQANSVNSFISNFTQLISGVLGGILYGFFGLLPVLIINGGSFILSALCELAIRVKNPNKIKDKGKLGFGEFKKDFIEGLNFIKKQGLILKIVVCAVFINFSVAPYFSVGITYVCKKVLRISDMQLGLLQTITAVGGLAAPFVASIVCKKLPVEKIVKWMIFTITFMLLFVVGSYSQLFIKASGNTLVPFIALAVFLTIEFILFMIFNIAVGTAFQKLVPPEMMGRAASVVNTGCTAAMPLGQIVIGGLFDQISAVYVGFIVIIILLCTGIYYSLSIRGNKFAISDTQDV